MRPDRSPGGPNRGPPDPYQPQRHTPGEHMTILIVGTGASAVSLAGRLAAGGLSTRVAGRNPQALARFAGDTVRIDLAQPRELDRALSQAAVVINCAGPFAHTYEAVMTAALRTRTPYIDLANEVDVVAGVLDRDGEARDRGVALVTGAGYGVAAAECLALHLAAELPDVAQIEIAAAPAVAATSAGVQRTVAEALAGGGRLIRDGRLQPVPLGSVSRTVVFPAGPRTVNAVPTGDLVAVQHATGAESVTVYHAGGPASTGPEPVST